MKKSYRFVKRVLDIFFAFLLLILLSWLLLIMLIVGLIVFKGHPIFKQKRLGKDDRLFTIYKFRSMALHAPSNVKTNEIDPTRNYINWWGRFIRKTSLDELPQLINILNGTMSFVGPRPLIASEEVNILRRENGLLSMKPGITGWAQINGRDTLEPEEKVKLDEFYFHHANSFLDFKIVILTALNIFLRKDVVDGEIDLTYVNSVKNSYLKPKIGTKIFFACLLVATLIGLGFFNLQSGSDTSSFSSSFTETLFNVKEDLGVVLPEEIVIKKAFENDETYLVGAKHKYSVRYLGDQKVTEFEVCYESSNSLVATISLYGGDFVALEPGEVVIKAYMLNNPLIFDELTISIIDTPLIPSTLEEVFPLEEAKRYTIERAINHEIKKGLTGQIRLNYQAGLFSKEVFFKSEDATILTVNENGLIRGIASGSTTVSIALKANSALSFMIPITVTDDAVISTSKVIDHTSNLNDKEHYVRQRIDFNKIVTFDGDDNSFTLTSNSETVLINDNHVMVVKPDEMITIIATSNQNPSINISYSFKSLATSSADFRFQRDYWGRVINGQSFYPSLEFGYHAILEDGTKTVLYTNDILNVPGTLSLSSSNLEGLNIQHNGVVSLRATGTYTLSINYLTEDGRLITNQAYFKVVSQKLVNLERLLRKLIGHFGIFVLLGSLILINIYLNFGRYEKTIYRSLICGILLAGIFESFQLLVSGRNPIIKDALINASGILVGVIGTFVLLGLILLRKHKKYPGKKYLYISSFYESMNKNTDAERIKSFSEYRVLNSNVYLTHINLNRFKACNSFLILLYGRLLHFDKIIVSKATRGGNIILHLLKFAKVQSNNIVYFPLGNTLFEKLKNKEYESEYYLNLYRIIVETKTHMEQLTTLGLKNVVSFPNFKKIYQIEDQRTNEKRKILDLVYFSSISDGKGVFDLIKVVKALNRIQPRFRLSVFGHGSRENLNKLQSLTSKDKYIKYEGFLTLDSSYSYKRLNEFDLCVFPTRLSSEGIPGTFIDMFIAFVPTLTADFVNARTFLNSDNSYFYQPRDTVDLNTSLLRIYSHQGELFNKRRVVNLEKDKYSIETFTQNFLEIIRD